MSYRMLRTAKTFPIDNAMLPKSVPNSDPEFAEQLRAMNDALLLSSIRQDELVEQLQQAVAALSEQDRQKNEFLAMLSHELRNPLAPIANAVEILRLLPEETHAQREARTIIERQTAQLTRLLDDLMDVSRITSGRVTLRLETVDLTDIASSAIESARPFITQHRNELTRVLPEQAVWVHVDPARMEQVVVNLLTNAAKYTPDGGRITLSVNVVDNECVLRVRDTGVGIAPEFIPRIFDLFTQAERSLARSQGGLGVGLAIVQRLVKLHQGRVEAQSSLGVGSEFSIYLPLAPQPPNLVTTPTPATALELNSSALRVLVVDDNVDATNSLRLLLQSDGYEVQTAYAGFEAVELARSFQPHVAVLDIGLPGLDGYEVANRIREQPDNLHTLLIALTGYGQPTDRDRAFEAGFDHHLVKPAAFGKLQAILATIGGGRSIDRGIQSRATDT